MTESDDERSLATLLHPSMDLESALDIGVGIVTALAAAHAAGRVHGGPVADDVLVDGEGHVRLRGFGRPREDGPASLQGDLHAFGHLLYRMTTGHRLRTTDRDSRGVGHVDLGLPVQLDDIIGRCLARRQRRWYKDLDALLSDLERLRRDVQRGAVVSLRQAAHESAHAVGAMRLAGWQIALLIGLALAALAGTCR